MRRLFLILFLFLFATISSFFGCRKTSKIVTDSSAVIRVKTAKLSEHEFQKKIRVQGVVQPVDKVTIAAKMAGTIESLDVREGKHVKKGTVLFRTDRVNLENAVSIAEENLKVQHENCKASEGDVKIARITCEKATQDYKRAGSLLKDRIISETAYEAAEADWKRSIASVQRQDAMLSYARISVEQAKVNLEVARKNLHDSIICAPYDGVITVRNHNEGDFVGSGQSVLILENQDALELSMRISSLYYDMVSEQTEIELNSGNGNVFRTNLTYIAPSIDAQSRTFEIKALLPKNKKMVSGALCDIDIILAARMGKGVPADSVIARSAGHSIVFTCADGIAKEVPVEIGFSTDGFAEILNPDDLKNKEIVVSGHYFLNDLSPVSVIAE